eukprot:TRINITY_DN1586_c0_g1_i4.p1 TRINITY_DN1586_c0_g1~~TRINITY_DN1586_c0_g1_i4.p1  ORF type:complete len:290 (-),score=48.13 TRINITY_DN1586_c0_g1_i4:29-898(-)
MTVDVGQEVLDFRVAVCDTNSDPILVKNIFDGKKKKFIYQNKSKDPKILKITFENHPNHSRKGTLVAVVYWVDVNNRITVGHSTLLKFKSKRDKEKQNNNNLKKPVDLRFDRVDRSDDKFNIKPQKLKKLKGLCVNSPIPQSIYPLHTLPLSLPFPLPFPLPPTQLIDPPEPIYLPGPLIPLPTSILSTPTLLTPTLSTPTLSTPTLSTPTLSTPTLSTPSIDTNSINTTHSIGCTDPINSTIDDYLVDIDWVGYDSFIEFFPDLVNDGQNESKESISSTSLPYQGDMY